MPLGKCHHCDAPAIHGWREQPSSQYCDDCTLVHALGMSVSDFRPQIYMATSPERLRRALAWERSHANRRVVIPLLEHRLARVQGVAQ